MHLFWLAVIVLVAVGCGGSRTSQAFHLAPSEADRYETAFISSVSPMAEGDDLAPGAGEYLVVSNNWDLRADVGGWWVEDSAGGRLPLGVGRQIDPGADLRVHTACGSDREGTMFACLDSEFLDDDGDALTLRDSSGGEVARFSYNRAEGASSHD